MQSEAMRFLRREAENFILGFKGAGNHPEEGEGHDDHHGDGDDVDQRLFGQGAGQQAALMVKV